MHLSRSAYKEKSVVLMSVSDMVVLFFFPSPRDIQERYRTLRMYGIEVAQEELEMVASIEEQWRAVFSEARQVDRSLVAVKKKFTLVGIASCNNANLGDCSLQARMAPWHTNLTATFIHQL